MIKALIATAVLATFTSGPLAAVLSAEIAARNDDQDLAAELELLQGSWELRHGNEGKGPPNTRSVKTIEGNTETLRRYSIASGKLSYEHTVEFKLTESGEVRVFTFFPVGGSADNGMSYIYKINKQSFYDIPGLLHGDKYRNYAATPKVWHWKRILDKDSEGRTDDGETTLRAEEPQVDESSPTP
jgi:hypothetical protein